VKKDAIVTELEKPIVIIVVQGIIHIKRDDAEMPGPPHAKRRPGPNPPGKIRHTHHSFFRQLDPY